MDRIIVKPSGPLHGDVEINGAKNSALKVMAACSLAEGTFFSLMFLILLMFV